MSKEEKFAQLENEISARAINSDLQIVSDFFVFANKNYNSKYAVVKLCPNNAELFWSRKNASHNDHVFIGPDSYLFRDTADRFKLSSDSIFYMNLFPFVPTGHGTPRTQDVGLFVDIAKAALEVVSPRIIVPLGYKTFSYLVEDIGNFTWQEAVEENSFFSYNNQTVFPLLDPAEISASSLLKERAFFSGIKRLSTLVIRED